MTDDGKDNIEDFTREYLRRIDRKLDSINNDIRDIKFRVGQMETANVYHTSQFDRLFADVDLIKRRLDLVDA